MEKDLEIHIEEKYGETCLTERIPIPDANIKTITIRQPKGFVEIYEVDEDGSKQLVGKPNLVTYCGRETVMVRLFNQNNLATSFKGGTKDEFVCWFGVGNGGCNPPDSFDPIPPTNLDIALGNDVPIAPTTGTGSNITYGDSRIDGKDYKHPFDIIDSTTRVVYEQDPDNYDAWIIAKITTTISSGDTIDQIINECGLFSASSSNGKWTGPFHLYAKVTFPSILKTSTRQLVFVWYLYC